MKNKSETQRAFTLVLADSSKLFLKTKKGVELNAPIIWRPRLPEYNKRKQLTPHNGRLPTGRFIKYACTKTMRQACAGRRRERSPYSPYS